MEFLKKIKFGHVVLILALYMGINIGLKYYKIYDFIHNSGEINTEVLIDSYEFGDKKFEFYYNESNPYGEVEIKLNGVNLPMDRGFYNQDKTRHIYIMQYDKKDIYQNNIKLEPIKTIGNHKIKNVYIYEFDMNSEVKSIDPTVDSDLIVKSSLVDSKNINIDSDKLRTMINTWKKMSGESFKINYKEQSILNFIYAWNPYNFETCDFDNSESTNFNLLNNEKIIIEVFHKLDNKFYGNSYYELTQTQYDEFVNFIKSSNPQ